MWLLVGRQPLNSLVCGYAWMYFPTFYPDLRELNMFSVSAREPSSRCGSPNRSMRREESSV